MSMSLEECGHDPKKACGFRCWYYWHSGPPQRPKLATVRESASPKAPVNITGETTRKAQCSDLVNDPGLSNSNEDKTPIDQAKDISTQEEEKVSMPLPMNATDDQGHQVQRRDDVLKPLEADCKSARGELEVSPKIKNICAPTQHQESCNGMQEHSQKFWEASKILKLESCAQDSPVIPSQIPWNCTDRKRVVVHDRPQAVQDAMRCWITDTFNLLDPFREDDHCWLHPKPQRPIKQASGIVRARGHISRKFVWDHGRHVLWINFGIVWKLLHRKMTRQQKDGFISKAWHLSHLCGNWTCLNPAHTTVEPGVVNIGRNNCFSHRSGCGHVPPCMKELKVPLGPDGMVVDATVLSGVSQVVGLDLDDFEMQHFEDDELQGYASDTPIDE